jgi:L-fuconolactonase
MPEKSALRIDSHQHFWKYDPKKHYWMNEQMSKLKKDFLPENLEPILGRHEMSGCVAVQAAQDLEENDFLLNLASQHKFIKGIVGWVNLRDAAVERLLEQYEDQPLMKGFRHILQDEPDPQFMLQKDFLNGIGLLAKFDFTYDILIYPRHLSAALIMVRQFPNQKFVLDHLAKPVIREPHSIESWATALQALAACENVSCKVSGMVTEAEWNHWEQKDFRPYLEVVTEAFGTNRLMFGSDWPVCLLSGEYDEVVDIANSYFKTFTESEQQAIFGNNAQQFYQLKL